MFRVSIVHLTVAEMLLPTRLQGGIMPLMPWAMNRLLGESRATSLGMTCELV